MDLEELETGAKVALVGALLTVVGAFLTWVDASIGTVMGLDTDGIFTLLFGVGVGAILLFVGWDQKGAIGTAILGLLTIVVAGNFYVNLDEVAFGGTDVVSAGLGVYLTLIGGIVVVIAGVLGYSETEAGEGSEGLVESMG